MKKFTFILCFFIVSQFSFAQQDVNTAFANKMNTMFSPLNKNYVPHGILLDYGMEFTNVPAFNGTLTDSTFTNISTLKQIYNTLLSSRIRNVSAGFVTPQNFDTRLKNNRTANVISLSGLYFKYAQFVENATINGKLRYYNGKFYDKYVNGVRQNPYETKQTFAMTPAIKLYKGLNLQVKIPSEIFYSNYQNQIQNIQIDFGNGQGYVTVPFNQNITVNYITKGVKIWKYKLNLTNGTSLYNQSRIKIEGGFKTVHYGSNHAQRTANGTTIYDSQRITATIPYAGQFASVNLTIDLIDGHTQITKPLIVAEGFDLGIVINPENEHGNFDYINFRDFLSEGGNELRTLIWENNKQYDIIYVDWDNGVDYLQRNAYALEEVIKWVNQQKANAGSTEPNVVLGQSMGGVIARYALADMEERGDNHDTRLFISHDAPQQGANIPVSVQYMYRHITRQYIQSPIALFGGQVVLPIFNNGVSGSDYLSLLDAPASKQLIKNFSTLNYAINNTVHNSFYTDLKSNGLSGSGGYPVNTRNIAISNGSECGNTQDFNSGDYLVNYQYHKGLSFWGDLLSLIYNPLGGTIGGALLDADFYGVAILGLIPGHSKYNVDFQAKSIPYGTGNMIYKGKVSYTKKILWLFNVTVNITNVQKNQPNGVLPFDTYGGGFFHLNFDASTLSSHLYVRDRFGFIPTVSALDIGENNVNLDDNDYLRAYVGGNPPTGIKSSPFDNFSTEFDKYSPYSHNHRHISFNTRNGDWLAKELIGNSIEYTDCSAFCSNSEIIGNDALCNTGVYSLEGNINANWYISSGANLVSLTNNGNSVTLTETNPNQNGLITLNAYINSPKCGSKTLSKQIWVGKPNVYVQLENNPNLYNTAIFHLKGTNSSLAQQGITSIIWERVPPINYGLFFLVEDNDTTGQGYGPNNNWAFDAKVTVTNSCGSFQYYFTVTPPPAQPCNSTFRIASNPMKAGVITNRIIIDPCSGSGTNYRATNKKTYTITIFNKYGVKVYDKTQQNTEFYVNQLKKGFYIVHFKTENGNTISKKLIIN